MLEIMSHPGCYNAWLVEKLRLVEVVLKNVYVCEGKLKPVKGKAEAVVTVDIDVDSTMLNVGGVQHGGCTAFLLDM